MVILHLSISLKKMLSINDPIRGNGHMGMKLILKLQKLAVKNMARTNDFAVLASPLPHLITFEL